MTGKQLKHTVKLEKKLLIEFDETSEGYQLYQGSSCIGCHGNAFEGGIGSTLIGLDYTADEIVTYCT